MTELERWKAITDYRLTTGALTAGQIPGYLAPSPLATITVVTDRPGGGVVYWSFQASLQRRVQSLVGTNSLRGMSDDQVGELLNQEADDAQAWLGGNDPDLANRAALVSEYVAIYRFGVTPVA